MFLLIFIQFSFLFLVFDLFLTWGYYYFIIIITVGGCQVLKPCRGLVSFCFMYLVLCTKSENKKIIFAWNLIESYRVGSLVLNYYGLTGDWNHIFCLAIILRLTSNLFYFFYLETDQNF